jgi:hypothetical protein
MIRNPTSPAASFVKVRQESAQTGDRPAHHSESPAAARAPRATAWNHPEEDLLLGNSGGER